jgi:hypothetical protein
MLRELSVLNISTFQRRAKIYMQCCQNLSFLKMIVSAIILGLFGVDRM